MKPAAIRAAALDICEEYDAMGFKLTIRQLYYQFVSRGLLGSGQNFYKRVVSALSAARLEGAFPMRYIEDRGRIVGITDGLVDQRNVASALRSIGREIRTGPERWLWSARWLGQPTWVSIWVEKEALSGVFEGACNGLGVGLFACKGYPSVTALHEWAEAAVEVKRRYEADHLLTGMFPGEAREQGWGARVLYFGDHDPDGLEIPESCQRNIETMMDYGVIDQFEVSFDRVALTMDQIREYEPPPFWAKPSSARYQKYVDSTGLTDAWELDALSPEVLDELVRDHVGDIFDHDIFEANEERVEEARAEATRRMRADGWIQEQLR